MKLIIALIICLIIAAILFIIGCLSVASNMDEEYEEDEYEDDSRLD